MSLWRGQHQGRSVRWLLIVCLWLCSVTLWGRPYQPVFTESASPLAAASRAHATAEPCLPVVASAVSMQRLLSQRLGQFDLQPVRTSSLTTFYLTARYLWITAGPALVPPPAPLHPPGSRGPPRLSMLSSL